MKNNFVEKSLKMPYSNITGYFELDDRKVFCAFSDDGERYFDKKDEEFVKNNVALLKDLEYVELPRAIVKEGEMALGDTIVTCSVLDDGRRIIKDTSLFAALKRSRKGEIRIEGYPPILGSKVLVEILEKLYPKDKKIIFPFEVAQFNGATGMWYDANAIPMLCDLYMEAEHSGLIKPGQLHVLEQAKILLRSLAKVGITALIDEATNYQEIRGKDELQILLSRFISEELQPYSKQFPQEYFKELFKLYGLHYDPTTTKRPRYFSQFNLKYVYDMLPSRVWEKLDKINPTVYNDSRNRSDRKNHIHRNLSEDGLKWLQGHLQGLIPIMTISDDMVDFKKNFNKAFAKKKEALVGMKNNY
ncbi:P63C domain-containing protein [Clostridium estertheticum]|uniref:P63C domain-containing protein n=1 Tax=Clostridium estertheticum TaxID=238834 RepID=UPI001C0CF04D|nr:P63C domain-containing protein [Clostridium estertheticum]MBU3200316.1 P63C domain-containing protein [Clostridium estertheticum]WAG64485.1 P63C domain-containing protein [Clostridium estertheticum]